MPRSFVARRTRSTSCSNENSGVCTPSTIKPSSRYAWDQALMYGCVRSQLMHVSVQKSTRTTWPRSPAGSSGSELSQVVAPVSGGMCTGADIANSVLLGDVSRRGPRRGSGGQVCVRAGDEDAHAVQLQLRLLPAR